MFRFQNGKLITNAPGQAFIENGAAVTDGAVIIDVGTRTEMEAKYPEAATIDANGGLIMPGFIDLESNVRRFLFREKMDRPHSLKLSDLVNAAYALGLECIKQGITTVFIHYTGLGNVRGSLETIASAFRDCGIRACIGCETDESLPAKFCDEAMRENMEFAEYCGALRSDLLRAGFAFRIVSGESIGAHAAYIQRTVADKPIHITFRDGRMRSDLRNTAMQKLAEIGLLENNTVISCTDLSPQEATAIKAAQAAALITDERDIYDKHDLSSIVRTDAPLVPGIGTADQCLDILEVTRRTVESRFASLENDEKTKLAVNMLFGTNTEYASNAFGKRLGRIETGATADIIVLDCAPYYPIDDTNCMEYVVRNASACRCTTVMAAGRPLMLDRKILTVDERLIRLKAEETAKMISGIQH